MQQDVQELAERTFAAEVSLCVHCQGRMTRFVIPKG